MYLYTVIAASLTSTGIVRMRGEIAVERNREVLDARKSRAYEHSVESKQSRRAEEAVMRAERMEMKKQWYHFTACHLLWTCVRVCEACVQAYAYLRCC